MTELRRKPEIDYYKVLQVDPDAEPEVIEAAYRALSKKYHPDVNRATDSMDRMAQINGAYNVLSNSSKRRDYNVLRNGNRPSVPAASPARHTPAATPASPNPSGTGPAKPGATGVNFKTAAGSTTERPAPGSSSPKPGVTYNQGSFRPQEPYPSPKPEAAAEKRPPASTAARSGPTFYEQSLPRSRAVYWLVGFFVLAVLTVGLVLGQETLLNNPLGTSFLKQAPVTPQAQSVRPPAPSSGPVSTPQPAIPTNRELVAGYLNSPDLYAGRVSDVGLTAPEIVQLRVKLSANGGVLNSDNIPAGRTADELDLLRQAEATTYNLVYSLFGRFQDLGRLNLVLTDSKDKPLYRADVTRGAAYTFYPWHSNFNANDPAEAIKAARQDRQALHFGVPLDENLRTRLNTPTDANLQAELQNIGLSAFTVSGGPQFSINYFQVRNQAETAVDFARILYVLYTRFPSLDRLQISVSTLADRPVKVIDRQLFNQIGLESWAQASYGGSNAGGDRQAQSLVASLPGNAADLRAIPVGVQAKFKVPVQVGNWAAVTESVERYENLALEGMKFGAGKDRQFLVVRVALRNTSDGRQWLLPGDKMTLVDTRNQVFNADAFATLLYILKTPPATEPPPGPIEANKQGAVYAVFNVPANTSLATLRLHFQDGDKKAAMELV